MHTIQSFEDSKKFYEQRFQQGYVEQWPGDKKKRVANIIQQLNLPTQGRALDFGCGNGVFTKILKTVLPEWHVYGCDISEVAIQQAKINNPECLFFTSNDPNFQKMTFHFLFSHHVLEHVFDIERVANDLTKKLEEQSSMLHIFPCGNEGSFEHQVCTLRKGGIDKKNGNRFFFEDEGHVRRMTSESCKNLFETKGFRLTQALYSNQFYGAVNWITRAHPRLVLNMFNPLKGKTFIAKVKMIGWLVMFALISFFRLPRVVYTKTKNAVLKRVLSIPAYILIWVDTIVVQKAEQEWNQCKNQKNGSEMYLYFEKKAPTKLMTKLPLKEETGYNKSMP